MSRKPGPAWAELNSELVRSVEFVCLKDETKAAFFMWALSYPSGDLPPVQVLAGIIGKSRSKTDSIFEALRVAGFADKTPNGKLMLAGGWVREHKTSALRVAKHRSKLPECNVTITHDVTPNVTSQSGLGNVSSNATATLQKEFPPTPPLRKTTPSSEDELGVGTRPLKTGLLNRDYWSLGREIPASWLKNGAQKRDQLGLEPVDMAVLASTFSAHYASLQNQPRTHSEWGALFIKWSVKERSGNLNGSRNRPTQFEQFAAIIRRESDEEILPN